MPYCSECGKKNDEDAKFCSECGKSLGGKTHFSTTNAVATTAGGTLSKIGGGLSLISLLFLPLIKGCGQTMTGVELLRADGVPGVIKLLIIVAILCAGSVFFLKTIPALFFSGGLGIGGLLAAYVQIERELVKPDIGGILAVIGFGLILAEAFFQSSNKESPPSNKESPPMTVEGPPDFCFYCGADNAEKSRVCQKCGKGLE